LWAAVTGEDIAEGDGETSDMDVELILVPYDSGHRRARMGAGPENLAQGDLPAELAGAGHPVVATTMIDLPAGSGPRGEIGTAFSLMVDLARAVRNARAMRRFPLVLAGNCNTAVGTVAGLDGGDSTTVVWFDAHGDFNTPETTITGFLDGMALAMLTGRCWSQLTRRVPGFTPVAESAIRLVGARDLDRLERELLAGSAVGLIIPAAMPSDLPPALSSIRPHTTRAYLHVDLDVLDPSEGCANEFSVPGGLRLDELIQAIGNVGAALPIEAAALTAYDPAADLPGRIRMAAGQLARAILAASTSRAALRTEDPASPHEGSVPSQRRDQNSE
jgi:arginase